MNGRDLTQLKIRRELVAAEIRDAGAGDRRRLPELIAEARRLTHDILREEVRLAARA